MNHRDLNGDELHVPFIYGPANLKSAFPRVGDWYFAIDTGELYSCMADGAWSIKGLSADGTLNTTNLVCNGSFEYHSAGNTAAPDGFALENTPTLAVDTGDVGYGLVSQKITADASSEGIKVTLSGLKASTEYSVSWRTKVSSGSVSKVVTTGALLNMMVDSTPSTFETRTGFFITDASGTNVVLKLLAANPGNVVWFDGLSVIEGPIPFTFSPKPAEEGVWADCSASSTIVGWASFTSKNIYTKKIGKTVFVSYDIGGTSNSAVTTFTLPYTAVSGVGFTQTVRAKDNGGAYTASALYLAGGSNLVSLYKDAGDTNFTSSGIKACTGQFFYET